MSILTYQSFSNLFWFASPGLLIEIADDAHDGEAAFMGQSLFVTELQKNNCKNTLNNKK